MTVDQIVAKDQSQFNSHHSAKILLIVRAEIALILGTTKNIVAKGSKIFAQEIGKYIDSKDQKRGKKDKKEKKDKSKPTTFADMFSKENQEAAQQKDKERKDDGPALWPLIRQVNVRCPSASLSSGAILVDLPGVADANAARNSIAKDYMKKCDCIWILAPIVSVVDRINLLGESALIRRARYGLLMIRFLVSS
jgi:hypothetical protein